MRHKLSIILLVMLVLFSCKTTKKVTTTTKHTVKAIKPVVQVVKMVLVTQPQFQTANVSKMSLELDLNERKVNASASCKIKLDSAMFISIQVFGFEVFKAEMMPDSMKVYDKMNRRYYVTDYSYFRRRFGVDIDYYSLQSLLAAQFFCVGNRVIHSDSCQLETLENGLRNIGYESSSMLQTTQVNPQHVILQVLLKAKNSNYQLQTDYADYTTINGVSFPQKIALNARNDKTKASCNFSILKVEFDKELKFQAQNAERYSRGDIDQLLKK